MSTDPYDVHAALLDVLVTNLGAAYVHDGEVDEPVLINPPEDRRVQPYWVLWFAPGTDPDRSLARAEGAAYQFQVTAVGPDVSRCLWAVGRATAVLDGLQIRNATVDLGVRWLPGYTAPEARPDRDVDPVRWFVPLRWLALTA